MDSAALAVEHSSNGIACGQADCRIGRCIFAFGQIVFEAVFEAGIHRIGHGIQLRAGFVKMSGGILIRARWI